ncbi:MAG: class 3 adenylate cyclase [Bacteriovoracaceae bacterium]|jgi:class 3 adenylate cyclase
MEDNLGLDENEYKFIDEYLKGSKTSVLTILFTDIVGYTEYTEKNGDQKANEVRKIHDEIMKEKIEHNSQGKIIKFIGDAVMAIFSEPSSAVESCVEIQRHFQHLYETGKFPLKLRMGLHLGQVTIERKIGHDIFGRHVNKAARVEAKASGGQIFATYPVVETLKGHVDIEGVDYHNHGKVKAKGITEDFEIFEILYMRSQKAVGPVGLKQKLLSPKSLIVVALLLVTCAIAGFHLIFPKLFIYNAPNTALILNHKKILNLKALSNQDYKEIHERVPVGEHFLYYQVSSVVRYYTKFYIGPFSEFIKPKYQYFGLPSYKLDLGLSGKDKVMGEHEKELSFKEVTKGFKIEERKVKFKTFQTIEKNQDGVKILISYEIETDKGLVVKETYEKLLVTKNESSYSEFITISKESEFEYGLSISIWKDALRIYYRVDYRNIERE